MLIKQHLLPIFNCLLMNTLFVGKVLHQFSILASTNVYATEWVSKSKPSEGTIIMAIDQNDGRGQIGSKWESEAGKNITLSIILYPNFLPIQQQFWFNKAMALGVCDCVAHYIPMGVKVKWPNDIYVKDNKISGILIQNTLKSSKIFTSIVGIGININQTHFISQPPNPTSFRLETGLTYDISEVVEVLCKCIEERYLQLKTNRKTILERDYFQHLYRYQEEAIFQKQNGQFFKGRIVGVSDIGKLMIKTNKGVETFDLKEVKFA